MGSNRTDAETDLLRPSVARIEATRLPVWGLYVFSLTRSWPAGKPLSSLGASRVPCWFKHSDCIGNWIRTQSLSQNTVYRELP